MNPVKVSVIVPVYNAERFIEKSITSILEQPEVDDIIMVEDGSTDGSLEICRKLTEKSPKIKLLFHKGYVNRGAAASRNLGIMNAKNDWLAFLDADDFYLPGRFSALKDWSSRYPDADGVYEAIGTHYYDEEGRMLHQKRMADINISGLDTDLTTLTERVSPDKLFETLIMGNVGWFHFNGLTLRKSAIRKTGLLDPLLWYGQDIDFFLRLSIFSRLVPGNLKEPVAMRGVYSNNSTLSVYTSPERLFMNNRCAAYRWKKLFKLMLKYDFPKKVNRFLLNRHLDYYNDDMVNLPVGIKRKCLKTVILFKLIFAYPDCYKKVI